MTVEDLSSTPAPAPPSGRRLVPGLATPFPMINYTSSMLIEDPVAQKICASLDEVLAPIVSVLDCYDSYLDAQLAPMDFVRYMCSWLLVNPEIGWDDATVRNALSHAIHFYELRGTSKGIERFASAVFNIEVTVEQTGGVTTSRDSTDPSTWIVPPPPRCTVTIRSRGGSKVDHATLELVLSTAIPAHVEVTLVEDP